MKSSAMKFVVFRIRCEGQTVPIKFKHNTCTTVGDLKTMVLKWAFPHLRSDVCLSLNGHTSLEEDFTLSDAKLVHGDFIYVLIPPGAKNKLSEETAISHNHNCSMQACSEDNVDVAVGTHRVVSKVNANHHLDKLMSSISDSTSSSLPLSLVKLFNDIQAQGSFRALAVLLTVIMNEVGFLEQDKTLSVMNIRNWTGPKSLQLNFGYPDLDAATTISLLLVPVQREVFISACVEMPNGKRCNLMESVSASCFSNRILSDDACAMFKGDKLPVISRWFKDKVANPLLQFAVSESGLPCKPRLCTLPYEVQIEIMKFLDVASLLRLSEVCRRMYYVSQDRNVWRRLVRRDFGRRIATIFYESLTHDWKQFYIYRTEHKFCRYNQDSCERTSYRSLAGCYNVFEIDEVFNVCQYHRWASFGSWREIWIRVRYDPIILKFNSRNSGGRLHCHSGGRGARPRKRPDLIEFIHLIYVTFGGTNECAGEEMICSSV